MGVTDNLALPFPELDDAPNGPLQLQALAFATDARFRSGTYATMPAPAVLGKGGVYFATDTLGVFQSDGAAVRLVAQGRPLVTPAAFATWPAYDGAEVALQVDATNGVNWNLRYNAASANASKWQAAGATALVAAVDAVEVAPGADLAFTDPATVGPQLTTPRPGDFDFDFSALGSVPAANASWFEIGLSVAGAQPASVDIARHRWMTATGMAATVEETLTTFRRKTGLAAGVVVKVQYHTNNSPGTFSWMYRKLSMRPVRLA